MRLVFGPDDHEGYLAARERLQSLVVAWARRRGIPVHPALVAAALPGTTIPTPDDLRTELVEVRPLPDPPHRPVPSLSTTSPARPARHPEN